MISSCFLLSLALAAVGCGGSGVEAASAEDADESVSVTSTESALTSELSDEIAQPQSATTEQLATDAATRVPAAFTPQGCITSVRAGAKVTFTVVNCTGPYGLVNVSGTVVATYSRTSTGAAQVVVTATGLTANTLTLDVNATAISTQVGSIKTANVTSASSGTGPRGITLTRDGTYTVTYDSATACITVNGAWQTDVGARTATTTVSNFARCKGACPTSGTLVHETVRGNTLTLTYSGGATAAWSTATGRSGSLNLICAK
jgi:hypothetical protein